jgi:hypothetical protein
MKVGPTRDGVGSTCVLDAVVWVHFSRTCDAHGSCAGEALAGTAPCPSTEER